MKRLENTGCNFKVADRHTDFEFTVLRDNVGFVVKLKQTTSCADLGEDDFHITYTCVCHHSKTEHDAIRCCGERYVKNWNKKGRIGKDNMILQA